MKGAQVDPTLAAQVVEIYDHHGTTPAADWAGLATSTVRRVAWEAGRTLPGRGHPDTAELARRQPRLDCPCPWCSDVRTGRADPGPLAAAVRERAEAAVKAMAAGSNHRHAGTRRGGVTEPLPPSWRDFATCRELGTTRLFYGAPSERPERRAKREAAAIAVCDACPARTACLEYALANFAADLDHGIWGGTTTEQRVTIRAQRTDQAS